MNGLQELSKEAKEHLCNVIIPFWKDLRDNEMGGYYGYMDYKLNLDKKAEKGCILNSRITWFFANAYQILGDESLKDEAAHGFAFLKEHCMDRENGGDSLGCRFFTGEQNRRKNARLDYGICPRLHP